MKYNLCIDDTKVEKFINDLINENPTWKEEGIIRAIDTCCKLNNGEPTIKCIIQIYKSQREL